MVLVLATGCGTPSAPQSATPPRDPSLSATPSVALPRFGVAGLVPPHFPSPSAEDWRALYASYQETGGLAGIYLNWSDGAATDTGIPPAIAGAYATAAASRFTPLVELGATHEANGKVTSTATWTDPTQRKRFIDVAAAVAERYRPPFLGIGNEVDRLAASDPSSFDGFVAAFRDAYDAVKARSPSTRVFTVFQLESLRGAGTLLGGERRARWELLSRFTGKIDVVAFTTYPFFDYGDPSDILADYYAQAAARTGVPIAFTEVGWPSAPLSSAPGAKYGGTPAEQSAFVKRFGELTRPLAPAFALWAFPNDLGKGAPVAFESVALRANDGTPKPALSEWQALAR